MRWYPRLLRLAFGSIPSQLLEGLFCGSGDDFVDAGDEGAEICEVVYEYFSFFLFLHEMLV